MAFGSPGADSSTPVTSQLIATAANHFGSAPAFWGRYFTSPTTRGTVEYQHATENGPLNSAGIRVLPVARQTNRVNLTAVEGEQDGAANAADFLSTFPAVYLASQGGVFLIFLDVEGSPSLSADYYTGWAQAVTSHSSAATGGSVTLRPCVYATQADNPTWAALKQATSAGATCAGLWIARYLQSGCNQMPAWNDGFIRPQGGVPWPILAWQYAGDCGSLDLSQTNPEIDAQSLLLNFLVIPPPAAG